MAWRPTGGDGGGRSRVWATLTNAITKQDAHLRRLATGVRSAVECGRLDVAYQPVVALGDGRVVGFQVGLASAAEAPLCAEDALFDVARRAGIGGSAYRTYHRRAVVGAEGALRGDEWLLIRVGASDLISSAVVEMAQLFAERAGWCGGATCEHRLPG